METIGSWVLTPIRFESGDALALRVERNGGPVELLHRPAGGPGWRRYRAGGASRSGAPSPADLSVTWSGGPWVRVRLADPALEWTVRLRSSPLVRQAARRGASGEAGGRPRIPGTDPWGPPVAVLVAGASRAVLSGVDLGAARPAPALPGEPRLPWRAPGLLLAYAGPGTGRGAPALPESPGEPRPAQPSSAKARTGKLPSPRTLTGTA